MMLIRTRSHFQTGPESVHFVPDGEKISTLKPFDTDKLPSAGFEQMPFRVRVWECASKL